MKNFKLVAFVVMASLCGQQAVCSLPSTNLREREAIKAALARIANKKADENPGFLARFFDKQVPFVGIRVRKNGENGQESLAVGSGVNLTGLDIQSAQFQNAFFAHGVQFGHSNLPHADFTGGTLDKANLNDSNLNHVKFENARIQDVFFTNSDLSDSKWRGAHLSGGQFDFTNANLADMDGFQYPETRIDHDVSFRGALNMPFDQKCAAQQKGALGITYSFLENFKRCPNLQLSK